MIDLKTLLMINGAMLFLVLFLFLTIPSSTSAIKDVINKNRKSSEYQIIEYKNLLKNTLQLRNLYSISNDIIDSARYAAGEGSRNNLEYFYSRINNSKKLDFITGMKNRLNEYK